LATILNAKQVIDQNEMGITILTQSEYFHPRITWDYWHIHWPILKHLANIAAINKGERSIKTATVSPERIFVVEEDAQS